jgi:hypothetical protein
MQCCPRCQVLVSGPAALKHQHEDPAVGHPRRPALLRLIVDLTLTIAAQIDAVQRLFLSAIEIFHIYG